MLTGRTVGAILAGGRSRRFGSDKAVAEVDGVALFDQVLAALRPQVDDVICCGRTWPGVECLPDYPAPDLGPLGGLCAALRHAEAHGFKRVLTAPVDVVPLPAGLAAIFSGDGPQVLATHILIGSWSVGLAGQLEAHIRAGNRSVRSWLEAAGAERINDSAWNLCNVNHPEDLPGAVR